MFQFQSIDRKRLMSQLQEIRQEVRLSVLFGSSCDWKGPHSHWGEQSALLHLPIQMGISPRIRIDQMLRHCVAQ